MEASLADLRMKLKQKGYKLTLQRIAIYEALRSGPSHPTAEDVHACVSRKYPMIGLSTIYNTLETFCELRLAKKIVLDTNVTRYDIDTRPHAHLICIGCERIFEYEVSYCEPCLSQIRAAFGFKVVRNEATFFGYCPECQADAAESQFA